MKTPNERSPWSWLRDEEHFHRQRRLRNPAMNISGGVKFSGGVRATYDPINLPSPVAIYDPSVTGQLSTNGAASFASASSQYMSGASFGNATAFTWSMWIKTSGLSTSPIPISDSDSGAATGVYLILLTGSEVRMNFAGFGYRGVSGVFTDATWTHLVLTYNAGTCLLYINGVLQTFNTSSGSVPASISYTSANLGLGTIKNLGSNYLNGLMDAVKVFSRAWSQADVTADYASGSGVSCNPSDLTTAGISLTGYQAGFDFNGSGLTTDYSGNSYTLTNHSATFAAGQVSSNVLLSNDSDTDLASTIGGSGYTLAQAAAGNRGAYIASMQNGLPGVRFTAANANFMQKAFTLNQPCTIWGVFKSSTSGGTIIDGSAATCKLFQSGTTWQMNAGSALDSGIASDANIHIFVAVFNGASSFLVVDGVQGTVGNAGANNPGGLTLASVLAGGSYDNLDVEYAGCNAAAFTLGQAQQLTTWARQRFNF